MSGWGARPTRTGSVGEGRRRRVRAGTMGWRSRRRTTRGQAGEEGSTVCSRPTLDARPRSAVLPADLPCCLGSLKPW